MTSTVAAGAPLTIDGPPQAEFYPVTVDGQSGWVHGAVLNILKDTTAPAEVAVAPEAPGEAAPVAGYEGQTAAQEVPAGQQPPPSEQMPPADPGALPADQAAAPVDQTALPAAEPAAQPSPPPAEQPAPADPADPAAPVEAAAPPAGADPAANADPAATTNAPVDPTAANPAAATDPNAQPSPPPADPAATVVPAEPAPANVAPPAGQAESVVSAVTPEPSPVATQAPEPALTGQASVPGGANLFQEPNGTSYVLFWVPAGSTVWRMGEARNGFVHVDYMAMAGWVPAETLADPVPVTAESVSTEAPVAENVRTPRPGSGVAFTTVELSLRSGPSGSESELAVVPAESRVVMTGVMENGFHRVDYKGTLGWLASDYLSTPPNPTATPEPTADSDDAFSTSSRYQKTYSRNEIVAIIYAAADRYGQSRSDMLRVAECESALDPYAVHPSGSYGLYQFIRSTWKTTPYGEQDVFDPKANSNAAAWMWAQGRQSEWVCK